MKVKYKDFNKLKNKVNDLEKRLEKTEKTIKMYKNIQRQNRERKLLSDFVSAEDKIKEKAMLSDDCWDAWVCLEPVLKKYKKERWGVE